MILSFTAIGDSAELQDFSCDLTSLEDALDILSIVVFQGHTIVKAYIVDEGSRTELPSEVIDGKPISDSIKKLEKQWKAILKKPVRSSVLPENKWLLDITRQRIKYYDNRIALLEQTISQLESLRQRAEEKTDYEPQRMRFIRHYDLVLNNYRNCVDRVEVGRQSMLIKLKQLERHQV